MICLVLLIVSFQNIGLGQALSNEEKQEKADSIFREAMTLGQKGTAESLQASLLKFEEARRTYQEIGNKLFEAYCLGGLGNINYSIGEKQKALESYSLALQLHKSIGNRSGEATSLNNMGLVYWSLGEKQKALEFYSQALPILKTIGDKSGEATTLSNIGLVYSSWGETEKAFEFYDMALPLHKAVGNKGGEALTLNNIGETYSSIGNKQKALEFFVEALPLFKATGDKSGEATALNNIGKVYGSLGENQKALEFYNLTLPLYRAIGNRAGEATTLNNIGMVYWSLGENQKATEFFGRALPLLKAVGDKSAEATTLNNIGLVYYDLHENEKALEFYNLALTLSKSIGNRNREAAALINIGTVYSSLGEKQKALEFYNLALPLFKSTGDKTGEATVLKSIGAVYKYLGENQKALECFGNSLTLFKAVGDRSSEAATLDWLMFYWQGLNYPSLAVVYGKQSVNRYQELRQAIVGLEKETQKTYLKSVESTYRRLAGILIAQGRIAEAEEVLAMLKEEEYLSYLRRDDTVAADLKGRISLSADEKKAFEDYEKFSGEITRTAEELGFLEKKKNALPLGESLPAQDQEQYDTLKAKYDAAVTVFNKYLDDLKVKFSNNDKRVAVVESDMQGLLKKLNQPRTVIISTIVGEDRLNLIVTTSDIQKAHTVEVKAADLNKLVAEFRDAVKNPVLDPRPLGKKLYDKLFPAALKKDLENIKADTIVWSLDGTLRYVPMPALWDGEKYLVQRYSNAVLTLASRDKLDRAANADRQEWLAFGVGVSKPFGSFSALPAVPQELCNVVKDPKKSEFCDAFKVNGVFDGLMLPDEEFTLDRFQNNLGKTAIVHIASHFSLNAGNETDSYLLLGGGTERRFSLDSLKKTRLDNIELLTLSACNTAMTSGSNSTGVEIEGFGALAQKQGAKTVPAALWAVADDSTGLLMTEFYRILETNPKLGNAEALRKAQLKMIEGKIRTAAKSGSDRAEVAVIGTNNSNAPPFVVDQEKPYAHPYFWSPFVLFGNWK